MESAAFTVAMASDLLGVSEARIRVLAAEGRISGYKTGRDWVLDRASVEAYQNRGEPVPRRLRTQVLIRDQGRCQECGFQSTNGGKGMHLHHVKPRSEGGADIADNLITLCKPCHIAKHTSVDYSSDSVSGTRTYRISPEVNAELHRLAKIHGGVDKALRAILGWESAGPFVGARARYLGKTDDGERYSTMQTRQRGIRQKGDKTR